MVEVFDRKIIFCVGSWNIRQGQSISICDILLSSPLRFHMFSLDIGLLQQMSRFPISFISCGHFFNDCQNFHYHLSATRKQVGAQAFEFIRLFWQVCVLCYKVLLAIKENFQVGSFFSFSLMTALVTFMTNMSLYCFCGCGGSKLDPFQMGN